MENDKVMFNWKDLFVKVLFLVGFFLILLWLYPNNNLNTFYDKVFNENIQTMKNAARNYYTEDRLPSQKDQSIKMNLETMIDEKIILPFSDKDNNSCNETKSYVEVTKINDDEYALKVSLTCGKQTDYILDTISLNDCVECGNNDDQSSNDDSGNNDNDDNDDDKNYCTTKEYEYKKVTKEEKYSCPTGFVKSGPYCSRTDLADKVAAHLVNTEDKKIVTAASINTGDSYKVYATPAEEISYVCSNTYDNAGTYQIPTVCVKKITETAPSEKKVTYTCSSEYTNAGTYTTYTKCYANAQTSTPAPAKTTYTCSSEYDNAGVYNVNTTCYKDNHITAEASKITNKSYVCGTEYTNAGTYNVPTTCLKNKTVYDSAPASTSTTYTCSSEYSNAGTYTYPVTCTKSAAATSTTTAGYYTAWSCGSCTTTRYTAPKANTSTKKYEATGTGYGYSCSIISQCPNIVYYYYYIVYSRSYVNPVTTYTCSSAYDNEGTYSYNVTCTKSVAATSNSKTTYTCSREYTNAGTYNVPTQCSKVVPDNAPAEEKINYTYTCSSEYANAGTYNVPTTCYKDVRTTANPTVKTTYTCSSAYINAGTYNVPTMCVASATVTKEPKINNQYVCDNSYDNAGTYSTQITCSRVKSLSTPATKSSSKYCPNPYIQSGSGETMTCYKNMKNDDKYYCKDSSAQLIGTNCVKYVKGSSIKKCDAGYILSNGQCYKYDNKFIKAELTDCKETIEYIWSPTETLEGWERTGNTRNSEVKCPEVKSCLDDNSNNCPPEDESK